ncbi:MAG: nitroreductase/quinone reductase family protein [Thermoleophilaceae bacterium]
MKLRLTRAFWRLFNPIARALAGIAPWWVVIETTGRKSGERRHVPLARGPVDGNTTWVVAVHGRHSGFVNNIDANPNIRLRLRGRWRTGAASVLPMDPAITRRFNIYARMGPATLGMDPLLVRIDLRD